MDPFSGYETKADFHSVVSIQLCELIEGGFLDWSDPSWAWDFYNEDQFARVTEKFNERFYWAELGILPPGRWKQQLLRKFNEVMPKYKTLYKQIENGLNPLADEDIYGKSRDIFSDFPQTQLGSNQDYASTGTDREYENVRIGNIIDTLDKFVKRYNDVDVMLLQEMEEFFSCLATVNMEGGAGI